MAGQVSLMVRVICFRVVGCTGFLSSSIWSYFEEADGTFNRGNLIVVDITQNSYACRSMNQGGVLYHFDVCLSGRHIQPQETEKSINHDTVHWHFGFKPRMPGSTDSVDLDFSPDTFAFTPRITGILPVRLMITKLPSPACHCSSLVAHSVTIAVMQHAPIAGKVLQRAYQEVKELLEPFASVYVVLKW
ncbi:hypothetical protein GALMADRAFT_768424 [Galerina marginata CBS 339.88]|uniref:Uncharacterized protein n=1 Tax=Galerina marginata (strain CBS 339.88) TaxID=685588 RepID=A0A067SN00_GALM3|nr:hypothetical protein GALMADRAFT_768424 [Galerina marginata CBS 339.88]